MLIGLSTYLTRSDALRVHRLDRERSASSSTSWRSCCDFWPATRPAEFFRDWWNIFDLVIVIAALVPASNGIGPVLRILRVFRVLRLVKTIPELRLIVTCPAPIGRQHEVRRLLAIILILRVRGHRREAVRERRPPHAALLRQHPRGVLHALPHPHRRRLDSDAVRARPGWLSTWRRSRPIRCRGSWSRRFCS
jgi:hypothetical protein